MAFRASSFDPRMPGSVLDLTNLDASRPKIFFKDVSPDWYQPTIVKFKMPERLSSEE
jgi:hypothetical protein